MRNRGLRSLFLIGLSSGTIYTLYLSRQSSDFWDPSRYSVIRFGRAALAVAKISIDYKLNLPSYPSSDYEEVKSMIHWRSAERLKDLCYKNGGIFVKVGQHIGALDYLLPPEYVQTMKIFHQDAPFSPLKPLFELIEEDLQKPIGELFEDFDPKPLGVASLAQVHKATLKRTGKPVAVKIQHPLVKSHSDTDLKTIELLVNFIHYLFPDVHFQWLVREIKTNLPNELNFFEEARNSHIFNRVYKQIKGVRSPKVYWEETSFRVLTMEFIDGRPIDDIDYLNEQSINPIEVTDRIGKLFNAMIFEEGWIHCDPHPGNVLARKTDTDKFELIVLDHGLYVTISEEFKINYSKLWMSLINYDLPAIKDACAKLGVEDLYRIMASVVTQRSWEVLEDGQLNSPRTHNEKRKLAFQALETFADITRLLQYIPRELVLVFKTNDLLTHIELTLGQQRSKSYFLSLAAYCTTVLGKEEAREAKNPILSLYITTRTKFKLLLINIYRTCISLSSYIFNVA